MSNSEPPIFSSTGELGTAERQDSRLYHNAEVFYDDSAALAATLEDLNRTAAVRPHISRTVFRGIVSEAALAGVPDELGFTVEAALQLDEYEQSDWLVYAANNAPERRALDPIDVITKATDLPPPERVPASSNGQLVSSFDETMTPSLFELWSETFGWSLEEIQALQQRLQADLTRAPLERSVWFSGLRTPDFGLASAAMAERLDLPARRGVINLVESTEWRTHQDLGRIGLMPAVLDRLNHQIVADSRTRRQPPLIYAECNFTSRSDRAGYRAGFRVPPRDRATQVLIQNVRVNDGVLPKGLRDFSFMHLPVAHMRTLL